VLEQLAEPVTSFSHASTAAPRNRRGRKVLLAEDNPVNVEVASAMLESMGLDVSRAGNGAEALHSVQADAFDLVLMDCQMPVMDGFAATSEIRRHEQQRGQGHKLPIIAITANALQGDRESCLAAGMDDYLSKPFTQQALGDTLARWINLPRQSAQTVAPPQSSGHGNAVASAAATPPLSSESAEPASVIQRQALENIRALSAENGDALLEKILHTYLHDTPEQFATLRLAIQHDDSEALRLLAHRLKSGSANVGAQLLASTCKELEQLGRQHTTSGAAALLASMEQQFHAVRQALEAILEKEA
jgi:two-component system sensor histidine kinase/response regulator